MLNFFNRPKKGERDYIPDYLNNYEKRKLFTQKLKLVLVIVLVMSFIYLLYDKLNRKLDEILVEEQIEQVPCQIKIHMAKDSLHLHYGKIIDSISTVRNFKNRK